MPYETKKRTVIKTLIWRVIAFISVIIVSYIINGSFNNALKVGVIDQFLKLILYYVYERFFTHIKWGIITQENGQQIQPENV